LATGSELLEHEPGDLTCIVEAGMRVSTLQEHLAAHGQMLALDPPGDPTIGECVDGNLSGPRRHRYGAPRDLVIGMTVRLADGTLASSGGKVVKNVAGYDLGKLFCGAGGAFGEVIRVALRLHPRPAATATLAVPVSVPETAVRLTQLLLRSQLVPSGVDLLWPGRLAVLFEGSRRAVDAQVAAAQELLGGALDPAVWADVATRQLAAGGRVRFDRLDAFLASASDAVVRVSGLTAYVPEAPAYAPSPLAERIRTELGR
jgi:glycolate dehydrogenase FAD-binding subunit